MSLVGFKATNHRQQVAKRGRNELTDDRGTDPQWFEAIARRFGGFTLDAAAAPHNAKCERYYTEDDNGLEQTWARHRVWCNPPYSNIGPWVAKAWAEFPACPIIVMLLPANRTEQRWWQAQVEPRRDKRAYGGGLSVEFLPGRMRFVKPGADGVGANERPPFGCCLLIWRHR